MKTILLCFAALLMSAATFAQTKLADEFPALMKARNTDAEGFFRTRLAPDVSFIAGHNGSLQNKDYVMNLFKAQKNQTTDLSNLNIQQAADLAVVTGISTINSVFPDGKTGTYKDAFTYTLRWQNGNGAAPRWLFTNLHHTKIEYRVAGQAEADEAAVRTVIETETRAYHEANSELLKVQWSTKPYAERQQATLKAALGVPYVKGDKLRSFSDAYFKTLKPSGQTTRISDYDVHISGAMAWATYTQERLDKAGAVLAKQREIRVLEREEGGWKIVFISLHPIE